MCADPRSVETIRKIVMDHLTGPSVARALQPLGDPDGSVAKFRDKVQLSLSAVTTSGYNRNAEMHSCHGDMHIIYSEAKSLSNPIDYAVQSVQGEKSAFVVRVQDFDVSLNELGRAAIGDWRAHRFLGSWAGTVECAGLDGAKDGPAGPFSGVVSAQIDTDWRVKTDRLARGGGTESMAGVIQDGGEFRLSGSGANSPDDKWTASYFGRVSGPSIAAKGSITPTGGSGVRQCSIELRRK